MTISTDPVARKQASQKFADAQKVIEGLPPNRLLADALKAQLPALKAAWATLGQDPDKFPSGDVGSAGKVFYQIGMLFPA